VRISAQGDLRLCGFSHGLHMCDWMTYRKYLIFNVKNANCRAETSGLACA
jgi:hypothetical protein